MLHFKVCERRRARAAERDAPRFYAEDVAAIERTLPRKLAARVRAEMEASGTRHAR